MVVSAVTALLARAISALLIPLAAVGVLALAVIALSVAARDPVDLWEPFPVPKTTVPSRGVAAPAAASSMKPVDVGSPDRVSRKEPQQTRKQVVRKSKGLLTPNHMLISSGTLIHATELGCSESSLSSQVSTTVSDAAVKAAVLLKQSPIPDTIAKWTSTTVNGYSRVDSAFGIHNQMEKLSQAAVKGGIAAASIAATAAIKAGVAYQIAPSYKEIHGLETDSEDDALSSSSEDASSLPTYQRNQLEVYNSSESGSHRVLAKRAKRMKSSATLASSSRSNYSQNSRYLDYISKNGPCVRIVKLDTSIPGSFPPKQLVESGTNTDPAITGIGLMQDADDACAECGRVGPSRLTPFNDIANQYRRQVIDGEQKEQPSSSVLGSLFSTSTLVAGRVVTASSTYLLGKDTTDILLGVNETPKSEKNEPTAKEETFIQQATREARELLASSPIRCFCVGGVYSATSLRTLMRGKGSKLKKWFTGIEGKCDNLDEETVKEWMSNGVMMRDGTFFIDREGTHFHHIINHLRGIALSPALDSRSVLHSLRQEALFYNVVPLVVEIDERLLCLEMIEEEEIYELEKSISLKHDNETDEVTLEQSERSSNRIISFSSLSSVAREPSSSPGSFNLTRNSFGSLNSGSNTVSPDLKAASLTVESVVSSPVAEVEGLRRRKPALISTVPSPQQPVGTQGVPQSATNTTAALTGADMAATLVSALPTALANSTLVSTASAAVTALPPTITNSVFVTSAFSFASSFLTPQKSLSVINPDEGIEGDSKIPSSIDEFGSVDHTGDSPLRQVSSVHDGCDDQIELNSVSSPPLVSNTLFNDQKHEEMQESASEPSNMNENGAIGNGRRFSSNEERLFSLLLRQRKRRLQQEAEKNCGVGADEQEEIFSFVKKQGSDVTLLAKAVRFINKFTWKNIAAYNALRVQQGSEFTPHDELETTIVASPKTDMEIFVESLMQRLGILYGMPPPPRNDIMMNLEWCVGAGIGFSVEIGLARSIINTLEKQTTTGSISNMLAAGSRNGHCDGKKGDAAAGAEDADATL
ncbi:hypothetical protein HDU84_001637 [Entophlyctis sp. JEL0112]|nr:hypothetical protein HDU84_001637 [Entophlyctis sp. JEL0112]